MTDLDNSYLTTAINRMLSAAVTHGIRKGAFNFISDIINSHKLNVTIPTFLTTIDDEVN